MILGQEKFLRLLSLSMEKNQQQKKSQSKHNAIKTTKDKDT
jgi:hypothetical protein